MQPLGVWPDRGAGDEAPWIAERRAWFRLWLPVLPTLFVAAWLFGWSLREPDPVHDPVDRGILFVASLPFAVIVMRAAFRTAWALIRDSADFPIFTIGLLRPKIVFSPFLAKVLQDEQIRAALEHELAHARHRDPLRICLGQIPADLQWPWPWAHKRFDAWLKILEYARDDEARCHGVSGIDLAAAVLETARLCSQVQQTHGDLWPIPTHAALTGDAKSLQTRIARLLLPVPAVAMAQPGPSVANLMATVALASMLLIVGALGAVYGELILHPLLVWIWMV